MKDRNIVLLSGTISEDYKYMKTKAGKEFATFSLYIDSLDKEERDKTEKRIPISIRIMVFDESLVNYLKKVSARSGNKVSIFGRMNSHRIVKGNFATMQNDVIVRDITVVKTRSDEEVASIKNVSQKEDEESVLFEALDDIIPNDN